MKSYKITGTLKFVVEKRSYPGAVCSTCQLCFERRPVYNSVSSRLQLCFERHLSPISL